MIPNCFVKLYSTLAFQISESEEKTKKTESIKRAGLRKTLKIDTIMLRMKGRRWKIKIASEVPASFREKIAKSNNHRIN